MAERYIIVLVQIVGNPDAGFNNVYYSDLVPHSTRQAAIHHGMRLYDHDDFLLGILRGDRLAGLAWQYEDRDYSDPDDTEGNLNELHEAARQLGLSDRGAHPVTPAVPPAADRPTEGGDREGRLRALVSDWQANGNSRELGDPTDRVWHEWARQLLEVLDGQEQ